MFEYQTAISELTAPAGLQRERLRGPERRRRGRLPRAPVAPGPAARRLARRASAQPRDAAHDGRRLGHHDRGGRARGRRHRRRGARARRRRGHRRRLPAAAQLPRRGRGPRRAGAGGQAAPARCSCARATRCRWRSSSRPGECGVDIAVGEGQTLGNRLDFGGPSFGFFAATEEYLRRMPGPDRGRDARRRRPPRLRAHAPDARAAHPPREGDPQHLHRPGAQRAGRRHLPELARAARASSSSPS